MKLTLSWLKDHLETTASLAKIVETLTRIGLEVEGVEDAGAKYRGFVVARVIEARPHPNADRLRVCIVDAGGEPVQVVCGAPNAHTGMKSVFSPVGTFIPGKNLTLAKGVIRGIESNGMLCSAAELELSADHAGIIELTERRAGRRRLRGLRRPRRSRHRHRPDAQPPRRDGRLRDRARPRRGGPGRAEDAGARARRRRLRLPDRGSCSISPPPTSISAPPSRCAWCAA